MRTKILSGFLTAALIFGVSFLPMTGETAGATEKNIVETAVGAGKFGTLVTAVKAAGLVETLSGPGPFTVFAPTDEAFAKLPAGTVEALLQDKAKLTSIFERFKASRRAPPPARQKVAKRSRGSGLSGC